MPECAHLRNSPGTLTLATESNTMDPDGFGPLPSLTRTLTRTRDNLQRPTGFVLGNEHAVGYGYDVSGRLATLSAQGLPNLPGKAHAFEYTYEQGSSLLDKVTGPVHLVDNDYETHRNVLLQKKNTRTVGTPGELSVIGYTVNKLGQRVQRNLSGEIRAEFYGGQAADLYPTDWGYDALGQVTSEDKPSTTADRSYSYDQIGNRLTSTADSATTTYTANSLNQYSQISVPSAQSVVPIHDQDGNMTTGLLNGSGTGQFEYDGANQLIRTQTSGTSDSTRYSYDAFGRRVAKVTFPNGSNIASAATVFIYDGWNLIAEYKLDAGAWSLDRTFTWGIDLSGSTQGAGGVGGLLAVTKSPLPVGEGQGEGIAYYAIYDGNGNIEAYLDSSGAPAAIYQYDAFGNVLSGGGKGAAIEQAKFSHRFSTKYQDGESGLMYYGYRYLDAMTARWLNRDPIEEKGGLNMYGCMSNDALSALDFLGLVDDTALLIQLTTGDYLTSPAPGPRPYHAAELSVDEKLTPFRRPKRELYRGGEALDYSKFGDWYKKRFPGVSRHVEIYFPDEISKSLTSLCDGSPPDRNGLPFIYISKYRTGEQPATPGEIDETLFGDVRQEAWYATPGLGRYTIEVTSLSYAKIEGGSDQCPCYNWKATVSVVDQFGIHPNNVGGNMFLYRGFALLTGYQRGVIVADWQLEGQFCCFKNLFPKNPFERDLR